MLWWFFAIPQHESAIGIHVSPTTRYLQASRFFLTSCSVASAEITYSTKESRKFTRVYHLNPDTYVCVQLLSHVWLIVIPWTIACQALLSMSMEFSRQEYCFRLPFPTPGNLPNPGTEPVSPVFPTWQVDSLPLSWTIKMAECWSIDAFELCWRRFLWAPEQQGNQTSQSKRKSTLNIHRKDWCWSWSSNTLATWCEEPAHWKRPWCWERLKSEGGDRGWCG